MGECSDFYVTEKVNVKVPFDSPHWLTLTGTVRWVWEPCIDVTVGDTVVRFARDAFDCSELEVGQPASVWLGTFEQHFGPGEYHPEEEIDYDG